LVFVFILSALFPSDSFAQASKF